MFRPCQIYIPHSIIVLYMSLVNNVLYIFYLRKLWVDWRNSMSSMLFLLNKDKLCMLLYFHLLYTPFIVNRIGAVRISWVNEVIYIYRIKYSCKALNLGQMGGLPRIYKYFKTIHTLTRPHTYFEINKISRDKFSVHLKHIIMPIKWF
jgi:hypothetical protein